YFCSHECPIGQEYVPEVVPKELSQITLEMIATLNSIDKNKNRLIEITVDGKIHDDELPDFIEIKHELDKMALTIDSLRLWIDNAIAAGKLNKDDFKD
ncbi:MAG: XRE family transcriptional regulator, partial [Clostridiales bacterium]|nr:XRE family transcriptional regulator [Clostridiales bacterium]